MHTGQIKHFYKGNKNGILSYKDENGQLCEIQFFHQEYRHFVDDSCAKKRGWKYGDTVEFEIEFYNDQPKAVFKRFVGNTLLERLKQSVSEDNHIEGYTCKNRTISVRQNR